MALPQGKKSPTVLVTDAREAPRKSAQRPTAMLSRSNSRIISVDNVLQFASEIPSSQKRSTPGGQTSSHTRTASGKHPLNPRLSGRLGNVASQHIPARTTKTSAKLVLLPETAGSPPEDDADHGDEDETAPPTNEMLAKRKSSKFNDKSFAERLPKARRTERLARVTAYCTAQTFRLKPTAEFLKDQHGARTKLYDDCLYCVYQLPLLGGSEGYRVRSSHVSKGPAGRSPLDDQIEANERNEYRAGWREESNEYSVFEHSEQLGARTSSEDDLGLMRKLSNASSYDYPSPRLPNSTDTNQIAELFVFSYGVAVFWNFSEMQEKDILADLTFSSSHKNEMSLSKSSLEVEISPRLALLTKPLSEAEFETEQFHFEYNREAEKPRIYNDMITLRTNDHMVKLAMSHAVAQSTKLSFFEERMSRTMSEAQYVPRELALRGRLGMGRTEVVSLVGKLYEGRVDVNLSSNMLDTPNFFWDSEPTLHPLYQAVREYLEIKPRIQVLNERCKVFLDLAEILSDSIADMKMTRITWIIIVLIVISILVTCSEVFLRFGILSHGGGKNLVPGGGGDVINIKGSNAGIVRIKSSFEL